LLKQYSEEDYHFGELYNKLGFTIFLSFLGILFAMANDKEKALKHFLKSIALLEKIEGEEDTLVDSIYNCGTIYLQLN
jgi:hypothetical protein